jgi:hypothetical protein
MAKMMNKPKTGTKVKTVNRGQYAPNVDFEENPIFRGPRLEDLLEANKKAGIGKKAKVDSTSKMKMGGKVKKAAMGASLKPVPAGKKGLAKLPTPVRNKMGFQKNGGKVKK